MVTCVCSARLSFHEPLTLHPLKQPLPCYNHLLSWKKIHHTKPQAWVSNRLTQALCMHATVLYLYTYTQERDQKRKRGKEKGHTSLSALCLFWHEENPLPCRAITGTNLLSNLQSLWLKRPFPSMSFCKTSF